MTAPRNLLPCTTYLVTRHCTQREWLLRGESETNNIFLYWLAVAAMRSGVEVHGYVQLGNHWHAVVTDLVGNLPDFVHDLNLGVAIDMNAKLLRRENFWSSNRTSVIPLHTADLVLEKLAEMITHPVASGFVKSPAEWPGSLTLSLCETHVASRPKHRSPIDEDSMPAQARLECTMPKALRALAPGEAKRLLTDCVAALIAEARERVREQLGGFLGADRVRTMPRSGPPTRRGGRPWVTRLADGVKELLRLHQRDFEKAYDCALGWWRARDRSVRFPDGTYLMRVLHRAHCLVPATS